MIATERGVCWTGTPGTSQEYGLNWLERRLPIAQVVEGQEVEPLRQAMEQLQRYFAGERVQFSCPLDLRGTPFQIAVWEELYRIPYGQTRSYAQIAEAIGRTRLCGQWARLTEPIRLRLLYPAIASLAVMAA